MSTGRRLVYFNQLGQFVLDTAYQKRFDIEDGLQEWWLLIWRAPSFRSAVNCLILLITIAHSTATMQVEPLLHACRHVGRERI